jgi:histidyl-tRNA synthetase
VAEEQLPAAYGVIDKLERMKPEQFAELTSDRDPRFGPGVAERLLEVARLRGREAVATALGRVPGGAEAGQPLREVLAALEAMGLAPFVDVDLTIVRGLAYYTGTVFELFDAGRTLRALAGGGRYDGLLKLLGGVEMPAVGFAIGDVVLGELLRDRGLAPAAVAPIDAFVAGVTAEDLPYVLHLAHHLRDEGIRVEYALRPDSLGKQLKLADARQARFAVVIGPDDRARGEVQLKDLQGKTQRGVPASDLAAALRTALGT